MDRFAPAIKRIESNTWMKVPYLPHIVKFIETGDESALKAIPPSKQYSYWEGELIDALASPDRWEDQDRRVAGVVAHAGSGSQLVQWLDKHLAEEKAGEDYTAIVEAAANRDPVTFNTLIIKGVANYRNSLGVTSAGRRILAIDVEKLRHIMKGVDRQMAWCSFNELLLAEAPDRAKALAEDLLHAPISIEVSVAIAMLKHDGAAFEPAVIAACEKALQPHAVFELAKVLYEHDARKHRGRVLEAARRTFARGVYDLTGTAEWMTKTFGAEVRDDIAHHFTQDHESAFWDEGILDAAAKNLGKDAETVLLAALDKKFDESKVKVRGGIWEVERARRMNASLHLAALRHLIALDAAKHDARIEAGMNAALAATDAADVITALGIAAKWDPKRSEACAWELLTHKSKQVRSAAARMLGRLGDAALPRARDLLRAKKADVRSAAVTLLAAAGTDAALAELESRLDEEANEDVRDQMLLGLAAGWEKQGRTVARADVKKRIDKSADKLKEPIAKWADPEMLPPLHWNDGESVSHDGVKYLIYRQSRAKEIAPDIEAAPMYKLLDHRHSGEFARAILQGFLASKQEAGDKWALAIVGLLGDDRLVPPIVQQIREWVDHNRGKLAEWAVQALALIGTDAALLAVDAMSIRYRSKMKNVGRAAAEAFNAAAERQGITPEELGDRVVPWLGFEPGKPRIIEAGKTRIEVTIGRDMKFAFKDLEKNKPVKSLPKSAGAEVLAEFKDLSANLREIAKAQLLRLENLLVRQRRWPAGKWKELFLLHPLLLPFAASLVWGHYDESSKCLTTFRALEDRSLTTNTDDAYDLPDAGTVGMIHPLELGEAERLAWRNHLADYEIEPPFPQLERDVIACPPEQATLRQYKDLAGTSMNAMTFKGRAERLGWYRGSVCDGGGITSYFKSFPAAGADAFLGTDEFYVGIDMYSDMKLGEVMFVRHGSVKVGSYTYDEPTNAEDARIIPLGQVPAIVFSEVMGDLKKIAGKRETAEE